MVSEEYAIVLDDDPSIQAILSRILSMATVPFHSIEGFVSQCSRYQPKAVFLDVMLAPEANGIDLVPKIKSMWPYAPLIVMTSGSAEKWIAAALEVGADDFVSKPIHPEEVRARYNVRARILDSLRKIEDLGAGDVSFSVRHGTLSRGEKKAFVSPVSASLLKVLFENANSTVSRETMHRVGWPGIKVSENALDQRILEIRKALKELESSMGVHCLHGEGYVFSNVKPLKSRV